MSDTDALLNSFTAYIACLHLGFESEEIKQLRIGTKKCSWRKKSSRKKYHIEIATRSTGTTYEGREGKFLSCVVSMNHL